ncbi:tensin-2 isoform X3 [Poecile atricapillus]|uniref:tensin-2 isoform X3 n=1 Tax=Poecile atricapillus TaxID=48891 RepID=UPI0027398DCD|nr:tensin-2 isoform X3 [Poecile atricapillus]
MKPPGAMGTLLRALGRRDGPDTPRPSAPASHTFRERSLHRGGACGGCGTALGPHGLVCRVCKVAAHKRCESKVTSPCQPLPPPELRRNTAPVRRSERVGSSLDSVPQRSTLPRTPRAPSPEVSPFPPLDLTFVTERILSVGVPGSGEGGPGKHLRHLAKLLGARHGPNYTVLDFGWPELLAPPLELLCSVCKALEGCLGGHPRNVAVLLCKGSKAPVGVVVGAFLHYSNVWGSPEQELNALSMRRFCEEKLGDVLQPSQRRYTEDFGALLSGRLRLNSSPQFLHHVLLPPLPAYDPPDGCRPFLKIYQSLQLVYTSGVYSAPPSQSLCVTLEPALLLKGDVMVRCYHRRRGGREAVFGVQFHTGTLRGPRLRLRRDELDLAWQDQRFPPDATVEFIFSSGPERVEGWVPPRGPPASPIDYGVQDPAVRRDSYDGHWDSPEELSHTWGPLDGSPYARVQKKGGPSPPGGDSDSPPPPGAPHGRPPPPTAAERRELEQLLGGFGVQGGRKTPGPGEEPPDTPEPLRTPTVYGTPEPLGTSAPYRNPTSYGTPISLGTPITHGTPTFHETPISHKTSPSQGTPTPHSPLTSCGTLTPHSFPTSYGAPKSQGSPTPYDTPKPYGTLVPHVTLTLHGPPASQGSPTSYGTPAPRGSPVSPGTPTLHGVTAPYGTPVSHRTPISRGSPTFHGTSLSQNTLLPNSTPVSQGTLIFQGSPIPYSPPAGTPTSLETPTPYGTPTSHGSPSPYGTPSSHGSPTSQGPHTPHSPPPAQKPPTSYSPPISHRTPVIHETLTPYGTPTSQETSAPHSPPTSYSPPKPHGAPVSPGVPISHITPISEALPAPHGTLISHGPPASCSPPVVHGIPSLHSPTASHGIQISHSPTAPHSLPVPHSPPSPWAPPSPWVPPCPPLCRRASLASPRDSPKRGVQRSLSEGFPPWGGYGRPVAGGYLLLGGLSPLCPCQDCQGWGGVSPLPTRPMYGRHGWEGPPAPPLEPPSCPHCGRPGLGLERGHPPGKGGYDPPAMGELQEPTGRRSPIEGLPWTDAPGALPESPRAPSPGTGTPGSPPPPQPPLPEKRHPPAPGGPRDPSSPQRSPGGAQGHPSAGAGPGGTPPGGTFVQDTTKFWYKPGLSREEAVSLLKAAPPGSFLVRRSSSFPGAFGLALRVGVPPPRATARAGDPQEQLVRHFLIETGPRGVKIRGCPEEPYFGSLPALVLQHSITPISLPCTLRIPHAELQEGAPDPPGPPNVSTAGALLRQGAACSVLFLGSVGTEALTGPQAVAKAVGSLLEGIASAGGSPQPPSSPVHFKVSTQGITLTDRQRKLFFRRHYPVSSITHCGTDPQDRRPPNTFNPPGGRTPTGPQPGFSGLWPSRQEHRGGAMRVMCLRSWTPSSRRGPSSPSSPKSCWERGTETPGTSLGPQKPSGDYRSPPRQGSSGAPSKPSRTLPHLHRGPAGDTTLRDPQNPLRPPKTSGDAQNPQSPPFQGVDGGTHITKPPAIISTITKVLNTPKPP